VLTFIIAIMISCQKNDTEPLSNKNFEMNNIVVKQAQWPVLHRGTIYLDGDVIGHYMRTFKESGWQAFLYGVGCYLPAGNCLPDVDIYSGTFYAVDDPEFDPENIENGPFAVIDANCIERLYQNYSNPLSLVIELGQEEAKSFFFNYLVRMYNFPENLIEDFYSDILSIMEFDEGFFIVNVDAENYNDCPSYEW